MLVDKKFLYAVVSLPAGVFQPYSGVKTSVLLMDKTIAAKTDKILFVKIQNDGFGLGAQRRELSTSDLPDALALIRDFQAAVLQGDVSRFEDEDLPLQAVAVEKTQVAANGDYNLSGDRYKTSETRQHKFELVELSEICEVNPKKSEVRDLPQNTLVSLVPMADLNENRIDFKPKETKELAEVIGGYTYFKDNDVLLAKVTPCFENGKAGIAKNLKNGIGFGSSEFYVLRANNNALPDWIYRLVTIDKFREMGKAQMTGTGGLQRVPKDYIQNYKIPLPPLSIQKEIVEKIEGFQRIIDGAKQVVKNYKPQIDISPDWEMVELGEVCSFVQYGLSEKMNTEAKGFRCFRMNEIKNGRAFDNGKMKFADISQKEFEKYKLKSGDILFNRTNSFEHVGRTGIFELKDDYCFASYLIRVQLDESKANSQFVNLFMNTESFQQGIKKYASRAIGQANINAQSLKQYILPIPPLEVQQEIVARIEREQSLVNSNKELITIFEAKIKDEINKLWEN